MMQHKGLEYYRHVERITNSSRETEARVLTQGALKLKHCMENWDASDRTQLLSKALRYNQMVWSIFQANVASADSPLPDALRLNLLRLGAFVDRQIFLIMAQPSRDKLAAIIDVNLGIATGLRKKTPEAAPEMMMRSGTGSISSTC